jgi:transposase InsO family protein
MRENGLNARRRRMFIRTTDSNHTLEVCENILNREFHAEKGGMKWVSDITYLRTVHGWVYLTVVRDLYEYNNVLKCRGYNLAHNFGHGHAHAADIYCLLNILGFLFHSIQDAVDEDYQAARKSFGRRDGFFWGLRYEICRYLHDDWSLFFLTVAGQAPDG